MLFSSVIFLFYFLPVVVIGYFLTPKKFRNWWLIVASLFFYAWGEGAAIAILLVSVIISHISVRKIIEAEKQTAKRWLTFGVVANLAMLGVNKYGMFAIANTNRILGLFSDYAFPIPDIALTLGISFFVFQAISYIVDAYRDKVRIHPTFKDSLLYISLFPQLIAGPIVRFTDIQAAIRNRTSRREDLVEGTQRFIRGLAKKVLIANQVAIVADGIFSLPSTAMTPTLAWIGILAYTIQIFFDFSGYSDMAIGIGRIFGFKFPENFNFPYISKSAREFWRRWHMSLSSWIRDYLYIPLGGSRKGTLRTYINLFVVFTLVGLWHGAGGTFILWGMWYGVWLVIERLFLQRWLDRLPTLISYGYMFSITIIGWTLFRAESLGQARDYIGKLFGFGDVSLIVPPVQFLTTPVLIAFTTGVLLSTPIMPWIAERFRKYRSLSYVWYIVLLVVCILHVGIGTYNPFIYFRF